jgi:hypothetical protein
MSFLINITSYISSLSKNVFNTKLINQSEIANIICLNLSYLFLVYPANSKNNIMNTVEICFLGMILICAVVVIIVVATAFSIQSDRIESLPPSHTIVEPDRQKQQDEINRFEKVLGKSCILFRDLQN